MKKKLLLFTIVGVALLAIGCGTPALSLQDCFIERRDNLFVADTPTYYASLCTGQREDPYSLDGTVNDLVDFGIVLFYSFDRTKLTADSYPFTLTVNDDQITGTLEYNSTDCTYSTDIERTVLDTDAIHLVVDLPLVDFDETLTCVSKDFAITQAKALEIATAEMDAVLSDISKSSAPAEVMLKIMTDYSTTSSPKYYWYIALLSSDGTTAGVLIDSTTGEIISKKI